MDEQAARTAMIRRAHALADEHDAHVKKAKLLLDAETHWKQSLNKHDRRNRDFVLVALKSDKVPDQLKWHYRGFDRTCSTAALKADREIFLQRLELDDFEEFYKNILYRVPAVFRNDKEVMLKVVSKNSQALSVASKELKNDRDVVMAAIQNRQSSAPEAIQYASKKMRGDRRIARTVLRHGYGIKALKHLPRKLQEDYKLVLLAVKSSSEECNKSYEILGDLSDEMLDEWDIVHEAVKRRGSNMRFVENLVFLEDSDIIKAACKNDCAAIEYCPDETRKEVLKGSDLVDIIGNGGCRIVDKFKEHTLPRKHWLLAVKNGYIIPSNKIARLPEKDKRMFLLDVLRHSVHPLKQYYAIPPSMRDSNFAVSFVTTTDGFHDFGEDTLAFHLRKYATEAFAKRHIHTLLRFAYVGRAFSGGDVWNDKAMVVALCKFDGDYYRSVPSRLQTDLDVVKAAFSNNISSDTICVVPLTLFQQHHDIAAMAIKACRGQSNYPTPRYQIFRRFGEDLVKQPVVLLAWAQKGWNFYSFGRYFRFNNNNVALEALKHTRDDHWEYKDTLRNLPTKKLLGNKSFMLSVVQANHDILKFADITLLQDFDFMLTIVSSGGRESLIHLSHKAKEFDALANCAAEVRAKLAVTDNFVRHFLGAIAIEPPQDLRAKRRRTCRGPPKHCHLCLLDSCGEAGPSVKRMIAEYADIPVGESLEVLRSALDTLEFWGY